VAGLSNISAPPESVHLQGDRIQARLTLSALPAGAPRAVPRASGAQTMKVPPAPPLTMSARFSVRQEGVVPQTLTGTVGLSVIGLAAEVAIVASGSCDADLVITLASLDIDLAAAVFTPDVSFEPPNHNLTTISEHLLASCTVQAAIGGYLKRKLAGDLDDLSVQFTQIARAAIAQQLQA
jgi:hypothetical protein